MCAQSCLTLCDPKDYSPPGSSVHGIFQARILQWVAISFSRSSSQPREPTWISTSTGSFFTTVPPWKPLKTIGYKQITKANQDLKISVSMLIYASFISTFEFGDNYRWQEVQASDSSPSVSFGITQGPSQTWKLTWIWSQIVPFHVKLFLLHKDTLAAHSFPLLPGIPTHPSPSHSLHLNPCLETQFSPHLQPVPRGRLALLDVSIAPGHILSNSHHAVLSACLCTSIFLTRMWGPRG